MNIDAKILIYNIHHVIYIHMSFNVLLYKKKMKAYVNIHQVRWYVLGEINIQ